MALGGFLPGAFFVMILSVTTSGQTFCDCYSTPTVGQDIKVFLKQQEFADPLSVPIQIGATLQSFSYDEEADETHVVFDYDLGDVPEELTADKVLDFECYGYGCLGEDFSLERIWEPCPDDHLFDLDS